MSGTQIERSGMCVEGASEMFVCPDCRTPLEGLFCGKCQVQFADSDGIPVLLSKNEKFQSARKIGDAYDDIYTRHSDVWNDQGRTPEFVEYFARLVKSSGAQRMLEIGCGEGFLLSAMSVPEKTAVDISAEALRKARMRTPASMLGVALAERLPFADGAFDLAVSVGVMEHFIDAQEATREVWRVLRGSGSYVMLIHVELGFQKRLALKFSEYIFPNFRPAALARWISKKATSPVIQPIQRRFTEDTVADCMRGAGLEVTRVISRRSDPHAPLSGPHVLIFVAKKPDVSRQTSPQITGAARTS